VVDVADLEHSHEGLHVLARVYLVEDQLLGVPRQLLGVPRRLLDLMNIT
jgi:hypothetical protein